MKLNRSVAGAYFAILIALGIGYTVFEKKATAAKTAGLQAPMFEVDPLWPKPLPNHWVIGSTIGLSIDARDNVWIIHRGANLEPKEVFASANPPAATCCLPAPPILEYDAAGNLIQHWGGPGEGYNWPDSNHGVTVDYKGNVWIGGNGAGDAQVLKFTNDGKFLMQIGHPKMGKGSNDTENLGRPAEVTIDKSTNEAIVADGYGNKRVIVYDADSGKYKRHWGAYGHKPDDTNLGPYNPDAPVAQQFRSPVHCAELANDGLLYVCDRLNDRIQVFKKDGTYVKETVHREENAGRRRGLRHRLVEGSAAEISLRRRWIERQGAHPAARFARVFNQFRRRRPPARPILRPAQHRDRFKRQHLHHGNLSRPAPSEIRLQRNRPRNEKRSRRSLAETIASSTTSPSGTSA